MDAIKTAIFTLLVFGIVIAIHEFGHFIVAKLAGVKVHEFAIGMGPKLFQKKKGETEYTLRLLPIGGYVKMEGEDEESDDARSFGKQPAWIKIAIVSAGAFMNFVLAIIVFTIYSYGVGTPTTIIDSVVDDMPAKQAGLLSGDNIRGINDATTNSWQDVTDEISGSKTEDIKITIERNNKQETYIMKAIKDKEDNRLIIGIQPKFEKSFMSAIKGGISNFTLSVKMMFQFIGQLFQGNVNKDDVSGPVGIVYAVGVVSKQGIMSVLFFMGLISINLGVFNLLPIPALDGSRVVFLIIELLRGKPVDPNKEGFIHMVGFVLLILLMIVVAYNDIIKFNIISKITGLFG